MAVHWNATAITEHEALHADGIEWAKTEALLVSNWGFGLMEYIGLGTITEDNASEFWARLAIVQGLTGSPISWYDGETSTRIYYTRDDIARRAGLVTNYSNKTRSAFMKTINLVMNNIAK